MTRPPPQTRFEFMERGWRPSLMWLLLATVAVPFCLCITVILFAFAYGVVQAVITGRPVPDLLGGIDRLPWQYIGPALGALLTGYLLRHNQVGNEIRQGGGLGQPPFAASSPPPSAPTPAEPSPTGGLVNNEAIQ